MEEIKKLLEDSECTGYRCPHEISGKHYVIILEDVDSIIDLAVSKERERIVEEIRNFEFDSGFETVFNEKYRLGKEKAREELINVINTK